MIPSIINSVITIPEILSSGITFGPKVCIVAPGPNGVAHYDAIPQDFTVIAVNKAMLIDGLEPDWWVIAHCDTQWFREADRKFRGNRIYRDVTVPEITETALKNSENRIYEYKTAEELLQADKVLPVQGYIRKGASVSAVSVQLAYNLGAAEILLCGVDMSGNKYWDKSENEDPNVLHLHGEVWDSVSRFNPLLHYMRHELGVKISTLSETTLNVPFYKP
ncbi:DUF115 domain-containing protein [Aureisphaera galaxeae]|uniref:6-hydroxymethylpterin diphosphokinase MptE-like protein n=1 Tax=Aureisphaera galaxeae TaxID=1538023 RepID=UPI002350F077|nr:6-hydroxymethylpterin diphosphokinase MptE-like protein [Aureisphaera galaxeae]MDC8005422.1 DUF115 domain-containing protein [Aureisphaera galaxeae]